MHTTFHKRHFLWPLALLAAAAVILLLFPPLPGHTQQPTSVPNAKPTSSLTYSGETHLRNLRQLTFGGQNAEAYFSADDKYLIFQHQGQFYDPQSHAPVGRNVGCDQMYTMPVATPAAASTEDGQQRPGTHDLRLLFPGGRPHPLFVHIRRRPPACPPPPDYSQGYVWPIYNTYTIYTARPDGSDIRPLANAKGYNAESTITRDGKHIVFTSTRNGDLDIYTMDADGTNVKQLTHELGYDGGPFWSYDGRKIVYRAEHPQTPQQIKDYKELLARGLIRPGNLELWVMNADGTGKHQVTHNGAANFAPYWLPDGRRIVFASNLGNTSDPSGFDLYLIREDGTGQERLTTYPGFDAFPMFSSDGKRLGLGLEPQRPRRARNKYLHRRLGGVGSGPDWPSPETSAAKAVIAFTTHCRG